MTRKFESIIFDLGGVLLNIDFAETQKAMEAIGMTNAHLHFGQYSQSGFFDRLDRGEINEEELFAGMNSLLPSPVSDEILRNAWNVMILDFPPRRMELLKKLRSTYKVYLLSNTNQTHYNYYHSELMQQFGISLDSLFDYAYFSFRAGMRKPEPRIFERVLTEQKLQAGQTLFIDDTMTHLVEAQKHGIATYHLTPDKDVTELFDKGCQLKL